MTFKSMTLKTGMAVAALTALGLVAAAPASAHTNNMYTYLYWDAASDQAGYATYDKTTGAATQLQQVFEPSDEEVVGIEVANEIGTEIGWSDGPYVLDWNHTTGAVGTYKEAYIADYEGEWWFIGLDTLNDGTTVTLLRHDVNEGTVEVPEFQPHWFIASVNRSTGELVPLVDITGALVWDDEDDFFFYNVQSLATDPATGVTYVFLQGDDDHDLYFLPVTVSSTTVGAPTLFEDEYLEHGAFYGADFDAGDGSLYIHFDDHNESPLQLLRLGAPSGWATAAPAFISTAPANYVDQDIAELALTIEHTTLAATGSELPIFAIVLVGTVAVLAGGVTVMAARRRADAGTV
jgi:hypothetical protein